MKPKIKKQTHYNLLLMRDDSAARAFRVRGTVLKLFFFVLFLLTAGGAAGITGGVHYWRKYRALSEEHLAQDREFSEMRLQLERLINLESVIAASNGTPLKVKNEEVGVSVPANARPVAAEAEPAAPEPPSAPTAAPYDRAPADAPDEKAPDEKISTDAGQIPLSSEASPLRISSFVSRSYGPQRLRITYELSAVQSEDPRTISGSAAYFAVFADGAKVELPPQDMDGTRFSIARMKPMQSTARVPQEYKVADIRQIEVFIELTDGNVYRDTFPFAAP